jgi:two-component sensor histidine kinase
VSLVAPDRPVTFGVSGDEVQIGSHEATILAIVLNETVNNALTHGLAGEGGRTDIETHVSDGIVTVEVRDDGPSHRPADTPAVSSGLGLQIIRTLVTNDLDGEFELEPQPGWTVARIRFPHRVSERV